MNIDPTRTDGAAQHEENYRKQMEASQMPPMKFQGSQAGLGQSPAPSAAAPVSATVEQRRHRDISSTVFFLMREHDDEKATQLLADFEAKAVAEATADLQAQLDAQKRCSKDWENIAESAANKLYDKTRECDAMIAESAHYRALAEKLELALSIINKWGALWIDKHYGEEDPLENSPDQWCIGGDFFDAERYDVTEAALEFAARHAQEVAAGLPKEGA